MKNKIIFGSLLLAIVQFVQLMVEFFKKQAQLFGGMALAIITGSTRTPMNIGI